MHLKTRNQNNSTFFFYIYIYFIFHLHITLFPCASLDPHFFRLLFLLHFILIYYLILLLILQPTVLTTSAQKNNPSLLFIIYFFHGKNDFSTCTTSLNLRGQILYFFPLITISDQIISSLFPFLALSIQNIILLL